MIQCCRVKRHKELCDILRKHYSPRISVYKERRHFYELRQNRGETINQWYARIKKGAVQCEFGNELEGRLKDQFITGMREGKILDRIFDESSTVTLRDIFDIALKKEAAIAVSTGRDAT